MEKQITWTISGIKTAYDYRPFGRENALAEGMEGDVDNRRWQDKEYDGEHGKYFFGARYFDPFFGLWMSPDPAMQYANPYTFGGDPVNFIDPTGLLSLNTGFFTIGWDSNRGWNFGLSGGFLSYTWYQNGSKTFEASIGGSYQFYFLNLGGSLGYSYNTYSGHSLSAGGHVCVGVKEDEAGVCAGLEAGGSMNWDAYGNFLGMTAYAGAFAELQADDKTSLLKVNGGYEAGLFGMEGRGWYAGANAFGLYAQWAENGGWSYGGKYDVARIAYSKDNGLNYDYLGRFIFETFYDESELVVPELGPDLCNAKNICMSKEGEKIGFGDENYGILGTNWVASTSDDVIDEGTMPITGELDKAAFYHDKAYRDAGVKGNKMAGGATGLFLANQNQILEADYRLAGRAFMSIFAGKDKGSKSIAASGVVSLGVSIVAVLKTFTHYSSYSRSKTNQW